MTVPTRFTGFTHDGQQWIVLQREPLLAYGPFCTKTDAQAFAHRNGGTAVALTSKWGCPVPDGCDDLAATVIIKHYGQPVAYWPFHSLEQAQAYLRGVGLVGTAVSVEEPY
jgi:hypothetical protein